MIDKVKLFWSKTNRWHRGLLIFLIVELRLIPGGKLGFTCNDPALSHPFTGDTITWKHLIGVVLFLPLAVMLLVEKMYHSDKRIKPNKQALRWYKEYLFGTLLNVTIVQTTKLIVGSPRPHFFDTCNPTEALNCKDSEYVPSYTCTKAHWISQSDKSFPSGHSSMALHAGVFLAYYLYKRTIRSSTVSSAQVMLLLTTVYCCVSRITDHRHHWWDVLAGVIIGVPILMYTIFYLCRNFEAPAPSEGNVTIPGVDINITDNNISTSINNAHFINNKET